MNRKRIIIGFVIAVLLVAAGIAVSQRFTPQTETAVSTGAQGSPNDIRVETNLDQVSAEGQVVPLEQATLSFATSGQLAAIFVSEGELVAAGTPLLQLDTTDQELAVVQAETAVTQTQANLETAHAGLVSAEAGLKAAEVGVQSAEAQLALLTADPAAAQIALSEANVAYAEAGISSASGSRAAALEGATSDQIAAAEAAIAAAEANYLAAQKQYEPITQDTSLDEEDRSQAAYQLNVAVANLNAAQAARDELLAGPLNAEQVAANSGVAVAAYQRDAAQAQLDLLLLGIRAEQIAIAETAVSQAQAAVVEAELRVDNAKTAVIQAEAALAEAEAGLKTAQNALEKRALTAPFTATVVDIAIKKGEVAASGGPVITLADFSSWLVETTDLTELNVATVNIGDSVEVSFDAIPDKSVSRVITDVALNAGMATGDVVYEVTIALDEAPDLPLRWGMTAVIEFGS